MNFDRFALPADLPLTPCAHCGYAVESVDSRGRCDDCACDPALAAADEACVDDLAHDPVDACGCDLCDAARTELNAWIDDARAAYLDAMDGGPLPFELAWTPAHAVAANDSTACIGEVA